MYGIYSFRQDNFFLSIIFVFSFRFEATEAEHQLQYNDIVLMLGPSENPAFEFTLHDWRFKTFPTGEVF